MLRILRKHWAEILVALLCMAAGWRISGFYVVTTSKTELYRRVYGNKLEMFMTVEAGTYLRAAGRSEYADFHKEGEEVLNPDVPAAYFPNPPANAYKVIDRYRAIGLVGLQVARGDVEPLHPASQHYLFEYLGWFLYGVSALIVVRAIYLARNPSHLKMKQCRACGATLRWSSCANPLCRGK